MSGRASGNGPGPRDALPSGPRSPASDPPAPTPAAKGPFRRTVRVVNPHGLHPRLADRFLRTARLYSCTVTLWNGDTKADGKNIFDLIGLMVMPDAEVVLEVDGPDAPQALDPLAAILAAPGGEDYTI